LFCLKTQTHTHIQQRRIQKGRALENVKHQHFPFPFSMAAAYTMASYRKEIIFFVLPSLRLTKWHQITADLESMMD
jgi:hypothetical protein